MNKIKEFLLKIIAGLGLILSTIFYVLFRLKKDQIQEQKQEQQKEEINELSEILEVINNINKLNKDELDLQKLKMGEAIILRLRMNPFKTKLLKILKNCVDMNKSKLKSHPI